MIIFLFNKENKLNGQNVRSSRLEFNIDSKCAYLRDFNFNYLINARKEKRIYIENSTLPFFLITTILKSLLIIVFFILFRKKISLFYRDIHWKFNLHSKNKIKLFLLKKAFILELLFYKLLGIKLLLPSIEMAEHIDYKIVDEFSPRCSNFKNLRRKFYNNHNYRFVYSGNIGYKQYDIRSMLDFFVQNKKFTIDIYCPSNSFNMHNLYSKYSDLENINFIFDKDFFHSDISYDFFIDFRNYDPYLDFSMPLKIFDSISLNIPIIYNLKNTPYSKLLSINSLGFYLNDLSNIESVLSKKNIPDFDVFVENYSWSSRFDKL